MTLYKNNIGKRYSIHVLVAWAFLDPPAAQTVNHIDGDKHNNALPNLEYASYAENNLHAIDCGLRRGRGEQHWKARLTEEQVRDIRLSKESQSTLAARYAVCSGAIKDIKRRKVWKHVA